MSESTEAKNRILIYGAGGMGKTSWLAHLAAYVWKTEGKITRIVTADGGGNRPYAPLIEKGIVECWEISTWDEKSVFANYDLATKGWWPEDLKEPNSPLLPPREEFRECPLCNGDMKLSGPGVPAKCPLCTKALPAGVRPKKKFRPINGFEKVGAVCFEGLTSFGENLKQRLRDIDPSGGRTIKDGDFNIAQLGQQHYGDAQTYMQQYVRNSTNIPVGTVVWTALELRGGDDGYGKPVYGPALPGKKLTSFCIPWFTDVLHLDGIPKLNANGQAVLDSNGMPVVERQCFLDKHFPPDTKPYGFEAKTSTLVNSGMPKMMLFPPDKNNAEAFFKELNAAIARSLDNLLK